MTDITEQARTPDTGKLNEIDRLKLQYATIIDIGKATYDSFFKLGAMSFTLNGLLFGGLSFFLKDAASKSDGFATLIFVAISIIGVVYNMGAGCAFVSLADLTASLQERVIELDRQLGLEVAASRSRNSNRWAVASVTLTLIFFALWIVFWLCLAGWVGSGWLQGPPGPRTP